MEFTQLPGGDLVAKGLADWVAQGADGAEQGRGTNVFVFRDEGRLASVTGFWAAR